MRRDVSRTETMMIARMSERVSRLEKAIKRWKCDYCLGTGRRGAYPGSNNLHACLECGGTGLHPIAREALGEDEP